MKGLGLVLAFLGALAAVLVLAPHASATGNCGHGTGATGNWCEGWAQVSTTTGGVSGTRCFSLYVVNSAPACATTTSAQTWQVDAGGCQTYYWFDTATGVSPPPVPNQVTISLRFDSTATAITTPLSAGTEPANGATFTFCATSTGAAGGADRAGTYRIFINPAKTDGPAGVGNYNVNSDVITSATTFDSGIMRGGVKVASIAVNAYPADSTFAYGTAADEVITITSTVTQPNGDNNVETLRQCIALASTGLGGECAAGVDLDGTTSAGNMVADNTFSSSTTGWTGFNRITGNAVRTGIMWTHTASAGNGAGVVRDDDVFSHASATFNIDGRIAMDSDGAGSFASADNTDVAKVINCSGTIATLYNKGETVCTATYILNARGEQLTRAMTFARRDSANTVCQSIGSVTPSSGVYSTTSTLGTAATCLAAADTTGSTRHYLITNTDQSYVSGIIFSVSSLLRFDQDGSGTPDNLVHECLNACAGADITIFNRGEIVDYEGYLINARGTQYSNAAAIWTAKASDVTTTDTQTPSLSAGKYSGAAFTLSNTEKATADTTGDPHTFTATADGNTATTGTDFAVSSLFFTDAHIQLSATLVQDNYPTENSAEDTAYIISNAVTDTTHGWCHVVGVRKGGGVDTTSGTITWSYIDPTSTTRLSGTTETASDGWTATHLDLLASTPLGTWNFQCVVAYKGNTATNAQAFTVSVPAGGGGFPGDPLRLLCAPIITNPGETVTCTASENNADGSARTGNTAGTLYDLWNPSNTQIVTGGAVTEIGTTGNYRWTYSPGGSPALGNYIFVVRTTDASPVSSSTVITIETDPTVALASSLATVLTDTGLIKGYTDTLEAGQATAATSHATIEANQATAATAATTNLAIVLAEIEETESAQGALLNFTTGEILDALDGLNVTFTGNFTVDEAALANLTALLQEHRDNSLELSMTSDFAALGFDGFLFLLFWVAAILFFLYNDWLFALGFSIPGLIDTLFPSQIPGDFAQYLLLCLLGVVLQYFAGDRQRFSALVKQRKQS